VAQEEGLLVIKVNKVRRRGKRELDDAKMTKTRR
jgi:hypothetical protein